MYLGAHPSTMRIEFLGTRGNVERSAPYHSRHSGVLVDGEVLLDLGEGEFLERPGIVFITHLHPDHAFFVTEKAEIRLPVYAPEGSQRLPDLKVIEGAVEYGGTMVTPIETHHSKKVRSVAYLVSGEGRVLYTGDMIWIDKCHHHLLHDLDMVITDGSFIRKGGLIRKDRDTGQLFGHNGIPDLVRLFRRFTDHIVITHLGSWFFGNADEGRRKVAFLGDGVDVQVAYDGLSLEI